MARITKKALANFHGADDITNDSVLKWFGILTDSLPYFRTFTVEIDAPSVAANTTGVKTVTVVGLITTDVVYINKPSHEIGLGIVNCRVSASDTLEITYMNSTGSAIDPASESYIGFAIRL